MAKVWHVKMQAFIKDEDGSVRPAVKDEVEFRLITGGVGGLSSLGARCDANGEYVYESKAGMAGAHDITAGVYGCKARKMMAPDKGRAVEREVTLNGDFELGPEKQL